MLIPFAPATRHLPAPFPIRKKSGKDYRIQPLLLCQFISSTKSTTIPKENGRQMLRSADQALYKAKGEGRNRVVVLGE